MRKHGKPVRVGMFGEREKTCVSSLVQHPWLLRYVRAVKATRQQLITVTDGLRRCWHPGHRCRRRVKSESESCPACHVPSRPARAPRLASCHLRGCRFTPHPNSLASPSRASSSIDLYFPRPALPSPFYLLCSRRRRLPSRRHHTLRCQPTAPPSLS